VKRIPIIRRLADDTVTDGTAAMNVGEHGMTLSDFRDLDGVELTLPAGARFEIDIDKDLSGA
jgi:hypothetical protein